MGVSVALYAWFPHGILYSFAVMGLMLLWVFLAKKFTDFGVADIHTFAWIFLALAIVNPLLMGLFFFLLGSVTAVWVQVKNRVFKHDGPLPFYGVILVLFVAFHFLFGFYT